MKKTHVEIWGDNRDGHVVTNGLITPAGVCGSTSRFPFTIDSYQGGSFGYLVTTKTLREWKEYSKRRYKAVRFQRVIVDF